MTTEEIENEIIQAVIEAINQRLEQAAEACEEVDGHMSFPDIIRSFKVEAKNINVVRK